MFLQLDRHLVNVKILPLNHTKVWLFVLTHTTTSYLNKCSELQLHNLIFFLFEKEKEDSIGNSLQATCPFPGGNGQNNL